LPPPRLACVRKHGRVCARTHSIHVRTHECRARARSRRTHACAEYPWPCSHTTCVCARTLHARAVRVLCAIRCVRLLQASAANEAASALGGSSGGTLDKSHAQMRHATPAGQRPLREHGEAGKPSPPSAQVMPPPPPPKRRASAACSDVCSEADSEATETSRVSSVSGKRSLKSEFEFPELSSAHDSRRQRRTSTTGKSSWSDAVKRPVRADSSRPTASMAPKPSAVAVSSESRACCCKWCLESLAVDHPNGESACVSCLLPKISDWTKTAEAKRLKQPVALHRGRLRRHVWVGTIRRVRAS
jgi:hypothetical protein